MEQNFNQEPKEIKFKRLNLLEQKVMKKKREATFKVRILFLNEILESEYSQEELDKLDLHSLNLFGVPLDAEST